MAWKAYAPLLALVPASRIYPPQRPPNPEWPDYVKAIYLAGCERIDELRKQVADDGAVPLPFRCYGCDRMRCDFAMMTGDHVPLCAECLNRPRGPLG